MNVGGGAESQNEATGGTDSSDVFAWGLRRYAWVLVLCVLGFGLVVPAWLQQVPERFEAQAQVGPVGALNLQNIDPLPRLGQSIFANGRVAEAVRDSYDPPLRRSTSVIPSRVSLITAQDNVVLTVVGRGTSPEAAANLANTAAEAFTDELNKYEGSVGTFAIQRRADAPGAPVSSIGLPLSVLIGVVAGLAAGLGLIGLILVSRRPVVSARGVKASTQAPVLGKVWLSHRSGDVVGLPRVCHRIAASGCQELMLISSRPSEPERHLLATLLADSLAGPGPRPARAPGEASRTSQKSLQGRPPAGAGLTLVDGPTQAQVTQRSDRSMALLVVREGVSRSSLTRQVEQFLDDRVAGVVMVRKAPWAVARWFRPRDRRAPGPATTTKLAPAATRSGSSKPYAPLKPRQRAPDAETSRRMPRPKATRQR